MENYIPSLTPDISDVFRSGIISEKDYMIDKKTSETLRNARDLHVKGIITLSKYKSIISKKNIII